jgi:hypothetical protein
MGKYKKEKAPIEHHNTQKWVNAKRGMESTSP